MQSFKGIACGLHFYPWRQRFIRAAAAIVGVYLDFHPYRGVILKYGCRDASAHAPCLCGIHGLRVLHALWPQMSKLQKQSRIRDTMAYFILGDIRQVEVLPFLWGGTGQGNERPSNQAIQPIGDPRRASSSVSYTVLQAAMDE